MAAMTMADRFTSIIDAFDDSPTGLSLDQVATRAELPRSTTHRLLNHLVRLKWLQHNVSGYGLGARAISWGAGDLADLRLREAAAPVLHHLHARTSAVTHLGVLSGVGADREIVHVDRVGSPPERVVPTRVGTRAAAHRLALGMAALAALAPEDTDAELATELHRVRRTGGLVRTDDYAPGLVSVAATIDDRAAVGIVLPRNVSGLRYLPLLIDAAARIRRNLD